MILFSLQAIRASTALIPSQESPIFGSPPLPLPPPQDTAAKSKAPAIRLTLFLIMERILSWKSQTARLLPDTGLQFLKTGKY